MKNAHPDPRIRTDIDSSTCNEDLCLAFARIGTTPRESPVFPIPFPTDSYLLRTASHSIPAKRTCGRAYNLLERTPPVDEHASTCRKGIIGGGSVGCGPGGLAGASLHPILCPPPRSFEDALAHSFHFLLHSHRLLLSAALATTGFCCFCRATKYVEPYG
ncbi:hypothetical protein BDY17DRAFT_117451 [Neohortaea acidophila]|uniref:Uncharacterized protein n=1 Tax=Neohortaea acidophila TaxID=245834 RepID=A0A6A6PV86_9PEZI|nr:uncharacterized protein BDY17DRAFT_117451 [Neohortaea acidophila]KAF2483902.1 hypothetical protein BDY17DRAFT_117451 [Neohortaea acidophila]